MSTVKALTRNEVAALGWNGDAEILDLLTNTTYTIRGSASVGYDHSDYQTKTPADTAIKKQAAGGTWNWRARPVILKLKGHMIAAATHSYPHSIPVASGADNIVSPPRTRANEKDSKGNWNLGSHFCLHYIDSIMMRSAKAGDGSWTDQMHQAVKKALTLGEAALSQTAAAPSQSTPTGDVVALAVKHAAEIIYANEGSYGSVNMNDNGALSIGKMQWHASRALLLMQAIVKANLMQAQNVLALPLYNEILAAGTSAWNNRTVNGAEAARLSALLTTAEGKSEQDKLAVKDITGYIKKGQSYGLTDSGALIYFADGVNQYGTNAELWKNIAAAALKTSGDVTAMFQATKSLTQNYLARRERVYKAVLKLNLGGATAGVAATASYRVRVTVSALNIRKGPGASYATNGAIRDKGVYGIAEEANGPDNSGKTIRWGRLQNGKGWIALMYTTRV